MISFTSVDVYAYSTHLVRSVMQISKYMSQFSGVKLLMGDFNDEPHSNAIRYVCEFMHITLFFCATPTITFTHSTLC